MAIIRVHGHMQRIMVFIHNLCVFALDCHGKSAHNFSMAMKDANKAYVFLFCVTVAVNPILNPPQRLITRPITKFISQMDERLKSN